MNKYLVYIFTSYNMPSIQVQEVEAPDIMSAIQTGNFNIQEIICVKLKAPIATEEA